MISRPECALIALLIALAGVGLAMFAYGLIVLRHPSPNRCRDLFVLVVGAIACLGFSILAAHIGQKFAE